MWWKGYGDRRVLIFWKGKLGRNGWNRVTWLRRTQENIGEWLGRNNCFDSLLLGNYTTNIHVIIFYFHFLVWCLVPYPWNLNYIFSEYFYFFTCGALGPSASCILINFLILLIFFIITRPIYRTCSYMGHLVMLNSPVTPKHSCD